MITILDCYTDEPAGLGVPPYLGTYPRYIAGSFDEDAVYLTIDDLRAYYKGVREAKKSQKTDITTYNLTKNFDKISEILNNTKEMIIIAGVHTPGKYLSAVPGTLKEIIELIAGIKCRKILTGPAVFGTSTEGGKFSEKADLNNFHEVKEFNFSYDKISKFAINGAKIVLQIPDIRIIEIETSRGCPRSEHCSFCTEPIKSKFFVRDKKDIVDEVAAFYKLGCRYFRIGKQSDFYSHPDAIKMLEEIHAKCPCIKVLHIDNVNPASVVSKKGISITKAIVEYCSPGNVAAFGVESFDPDVVVQNKLNSDPEMSYEAARILNKYGASRGQNGMPKFLPGINLIYGLIGESKKTNDFNLSWLKRFFDEGLLIRRINIRQVDIFEGTPLFNTVGNKFLRKNKKYYWKWRESIRQNIDNPMLQKIVPLGTVLKDVYMEIYDGNTTFGRQIGTYPLIVGIKGRLELKKFYDVKVVGYMLRSVVGEIV